MYSEAAVVLHVSISLTVAYKQSKNEAATHYNIYIRLLTSNQPKHFFTKDLITIVFTQAVPVVKTGTWSEATERWMEYTLNPENYIGSEKNEMEVV